MKPLDPAVNSMLDRPKTIKSTMWSIIQSQTKVIEGGANQCEQMKPSRKQDARPSVDYQRYHISESRDHQRRGEVERCLKIVMGRSDGVV